MISIDDFGKLDLRVAEIISVEDHPDADKLFVMKIKIGSDEKQLVAGIKKHYSKEELVGKKIIVIDNLEPAVLRGVKSEGMLLAASDSSKENVVLVTVDKDIESGAKLG
jgi:methionine--tRNA ligase beta chain